MQKHTPDAIATANPAAVATSKPLIDEDWLEFQMLKPIAIAALNAMQMAEDHIDWWNNDTAGEATIDNIVRALHSGYELFVAPNSLGMFDIAATDNANMLLRLTVLPLPDERTAFEVLGRVMQITEYECMDWLINKGLFDGDEYDDEAIANIPNPFFRDCLTN